MTVVVGGSSPQITFADSTVQNTAALPLTGGTLTGALTPSTTSGIVGTTAGDNANAGSVGEYISSTVSTGSNPTSGTTFNITSISLTAGDWDVSGLGSLNMNTGTIVTNFQVGISTTSATIQNQLTGNTTYLAATLGTASAVALPSPNVRINISTTTTIYLS